MQKSRLSGIVEAEEEELGVLVEQAEGGQDIVDCAEGTISDCISFIDGISRKKMAR